MGASLPGEKNPNARFSMNQVREIRAAWARGETTCAVIAEAHGVEEKTIYLMVRGKTYKDPAYQQPANCARFTKKGERHPMHRLSLKDVVEIKRLIAAGHQTLTAIGARFGVSRSHVGGIKRGKFWRHV